MSCFCFVFVMNTFFWKNFFKAGKQAHHVHKSLTCFPFVVHLKSIGSERHLVLRIYTSVLWFEGSPTDAWVSLSVFILIISAVSNSLFS